MTIIMISVFVGEHIFFDVIGKRQQSGESGYRVVCGRENCNFDYSYYSDYSIHYTYCFNIFVWLQIFNFINCRIIDNTLNVFRGILSSHYFLWIIPAILFL